MSDRQAERIAELESELVGWKELYRIAQDAVIRLTEREATRAEAQRFHSCPECVPVKDKGDA